MYICVLSTSPGNGTRLTATQEGTGDSRTVQVYGELEQKREKVSCI